MNALKKWLTMALATAALAGCGGGGGGGSGGQNNGNDGFAPPAPGTVTVTFAGGRTSLPSNRADIPPETNSPYFVQMNVRVARSNGNPVPDGTVVSVRSDAVTVAAISILDDPTTTNVNEFATLFGQVTARTSGGSATFFVHSGSQAGNVQLTASAPDPENTGRTIVANVPFTVSVGPEPFRRIAFETTRTTVAPNTFNVAPFFGSPYIAEFTVVRRDISGRLLNSGEFNASITPVRSGGFSQLDDPSTTVNEFTAILGSGPLTFVAGRKTMFFHAFDQPGQARLTVTAVDPDTGARLQEELVFTVEAQAPPLPANIDVRRDSGGLYITGSGGRNALPVQAEVTNGAGNLIPDASGSTPINNVQWEIIDQGANGGETLSGVAANGQNVEGRTIRTRTQQGIAGAIVRAGSRPATIGLRATADRADNNVDNGIQSPVTKQISVIISDGKLFSLEITSPVVNALQVNAVSPAATAPGAGAIPPDPNGTYSLRISVLATDRQGNPVIPGTPIDFGLIDSPLTGFPETGGGSFPLSGLDGNPQEGGTGFTAPGGRFTTAGGGAGPGDTLVVFGEDSVGNRDLESARRVDRVNTATSLSVTTRFNLNDDTGQSVDNGAVLPYVIGRATVGNITPNVVTNNIGVASTTMNYPVTQLGRAAVLWARGVGDIPAGASSAEVVTDAEFIRFPGVAPGRLGAFPAQIAGNATEVVTICVEDAASIGIQGVFIGFRIANPSTTTTVDGQSGPTGTVRLPTGSDGCTTATVVTAGIANQAQAPTITFFGVGGSADVRVTPPGQSILQAFPAAFFGGNGGPVRLRLINGLNQPIPGVLITGTCTATGGAQIQLIEPPGVTNANGETQTRVVAINLDQPGGAGGGTCTFSAVGGSPTATVTFQGVDICSIFVSPSCN